MDLTAGVYLFIIFLLLAMATDKLPFLTIARTISALSKSSLQTIQSTDIDDSAKQGTLLDNSLGILKESLKIILFTAVLIGFLVLLLKASVVITPLNYNYLEGILISFPGILLSVISFSFYFLAKKLYGRIRV